MTVHNLLKRVRNRTLLTQLLCRTIIAISSALMSFVLVYWLGAFLPWYLIVFVGLAVLFPCCLHFSDKLDLYKLAQRIDKENSLTDHLSTVYIFDKIFSKDEPRHSLTRDRAEKLAGQINLKTNYPVKVPNALTASLIIAIGLLISILYIHIQGLDFQFQTKAIPYTYSFIQKIEKKVQDKIREQEKQREDAKAKFTKDKTESKKGTDYDIAESQAQNDVDAGRHANDTNKSGNRTEDQSKADDRRGDKNQQGQNGNNSDQDGERGDKNGKDDDKSAGNKSSENQSSSLAQKAANAVGNALQKIKDMFRKGDAQSGKDGDQDSNQESKRQSQQGNGKSLSQNSPGGQGQDASSGESKGEKSDKSAEGQAASKGGQADSGEKKKGSGAGNEEGDKASREDREQEAMGKLSEIIGKRSENVKGEMTVQSLQGNQILKTDYSQNNAQHTDKGGDVTRDEVPQEMQEYVKNYMEQVKKHPYSKKIKKH